MDTLSAAFGRITAPETPPFDSRSGLSPRCVRLFVGDGMSRVTGREAAGVRFVRLGSQVLQLEQWSQWLRIRCRVIVSSLQVVVDGEKVGK